MAEVAHKVGGSVGHAYAAPLAVRFASPTGLAQVCLIVIDGWGVSAQHDGNAVYHAQTPVMDALERDHNATTLAAHGVAVGLPKGLMGNSEVGHMNVGAGRVCYQDICRIDVSMERGTFKDNAGLVASFDHAKAHGGRLHLIGLISDGGVHSHMNHTKEILRQAKVRRHMWPWLGNQPAGTRVGRGGGRGVCALYRRRP